MFAEVYCLTREQMLYSYSDSCLPPKSAPTSRFSATHSLCLGCIWIKAYLLIVEWTLDRLNTYPRMAGSLDHNGAAQILHAKASTTQGRSLQSFLASLSVAGLIFIFEISLFVVSRRKWPQV